MLKITDHQMTQLEAVVAEAEISELVAFARDHVLDEDDPCSHADLTARVRELAAVASAWGAVQPTTLQRIVALGLALGAPLFDRDEEVRRHFESSRDHIDEAVFHFYTDLCDELDRTTSGDRSRTMSGNPSRATSPAGPGGGA